MLIPSSAPLSAHHPVTQTPYPPPLPPPLVRFPELGVFHVLSPFLIFPTHFFSLPLYSLSLLFIFSKWMRTYTVCPSLIDLLHSAYYPQFHPRLSKWWVFVISNGWVIFHCIHRPQLLYPSSFDGHRGSFHSLATVDIAARNIGVQVSRCFIASVSLG